MSTNGGAPLLRLDGVSKSFGGLQAVLHLSLHVAEGEILGLIGPNGAGKTTVFNLITRFLEPDEGEITFRGRSLLGLKPHGVCALGITRTFQLVKPFADLTVLDNVMVGAFHFTRSRTDARREALAILERLRLDHLRNTKAGSLTISDRKLLEIARALATKPTLLLLDEPMAGMNPTEVDRMMQQTLLIRQSGVTVFIIEHVMKAMMSISDRIVVLRHGEKVAEGAPRTISQDPDVIAAYLGEAVHVP